MNDRRTTVLSCFLACGLTLLSSLAAVAQVARNRSDDLARRTVASDRLAARESVAPLLDVEPLLAPEVRTGWAVFQLGVPGEWRGYVDRHTGRLEYAEGAGIPWIPGRGNRLTRADVVPFLDGKAEVDVAALEKIARGFLAQVGKLLGVDPANLVLDRGRSGQAADYLWFLDFNLVRDGKTVEGSRVTFTVNNGNLIQFGTVELPAPDAAVPPAGIAREAALDMLGRHVGGFDRGDLFSDPGSLHLLPVDAGTGSALAGAGLGAAGRGLLAVWQFTFHREKVMGNWRGQIDATTGELLAFGDVNEYAKVTGGIYPKTPATDAEVPRPMPFAGLTSGVFTDSAGFYDFLGGAVSSSLTGPYVSIHDSCGSIGKSANGAGTLAFGQSAGTDCVTPGSGGAGNTHASRMQFYQVNRMKEAGRGWLPTNSWLSSPLGVNVNLFQTCNAYWNSSTLNFFRSGGGCGNTGEIAGVSLHEYGHGLDQNDGGGTSPDGGTRESYADVTAALVTHDSCGGPGFFLSGNCAGYGDACTACSGVRDIDWARHTSGVPHTVANFTQSRCPFGFGDNGPCGREAHCESYVPSEAVWDLAARDLPGAGNAAAWAVVDRLWYRSRAAAGSAFTCNTAPATWTSDGCAAGSLWRVLRAADDDDGNLANGTPHSCALYAALARHGIACPGDPAAATCFAACTPPTVPTLSLTPGHRQMRLDWTDQGASVVYDIYRNESSCGGGFTRIASTLVGTSYLDGAVADGLTYNYQVIARPNGNEACAAAPSACQSAAPVAPPCTLTAPATLTANPSSPHQVALAWIAVAGAAEYDVYRATTSGGPYTQVQTVQAPATTVTDGGLTSGTAVFYVVRAVADCESASSPEATATPFSCSGQTLYSNDFENGSGLADWTTGALNGAPASEWRGIETCAAHGGQKVFRFGGVACDADYDFGQNAYAQVAGAAGVAVPAGAADARLSFWHRFDFEDFYDGGYLALSLDGTSFVTVPFAAYLTNPPNNSYTGQWNGTATTFLNTVVDLDAACVAAGAAGGCGGHTVFVRFVVSGFYAFASQGWFLDDVTITACLPHGCTGAPVAGAATTPADGQVQVSWGNGVPPSASFDVYRAVGSCASPGPFTRLGSLLSGSPFLDTTASGAVTYAYRITGFEGTGQCESDPSSCLQATATGPCTAAPVFAGLATAANGATDICSTQLSWPAAIPLCGGPVTYNVYRGTTAGFTPAPANRIATGLSGTAFADPGPLADSTTYFYLVRAVDSADGVEDGNLVRQSAAPTGPSSIGTFAETFEGAASGGGFDHPGWSHSALSGPLDWSWSTFEAQSPTHSWFSPDLTTPADRVLVSPPFGVLSGTTLSFWHTYAFYSCYDGGTLEISTDGGTTWSVLPSSAFTTGGYTSYLYGSSNPLSNRPAWCFGNLNPPTPVVADLSAYAGSQVRLRWHAGESGYSNGSTGWFVDSVSITHTQLTAVCSPTPPPALQFYTLTPCRLVDTRNSNGPLGGPVLPGSAQRGFTLAGACGVPATARALSVNVTAVQPAAAGGLRIFAADLPVPPLSSVVNFRSGQIRTNNAVLGLSTNGSVLVLNDAAGAVHLLIDVNGYYQ